MSKNKYFRIVCLMISIIILALVIAAESVENIAYEAEESALADMESTKYVTVEAVCGFLE